MTKDTWLDVQRIGLSLGACASTLPIVACEIQKAAQSPLERALAHGALCGQQMLGGAEILGHCPACYGGLAGFALTMWLLGRLPAPAPRPVRA